MELAVESAGSDSVTVLTARGELDIATVARLRDAIGTALAAPPPVVYLDLTGLSFIDSTGCRELVRAAKAATAAGTALEVVCPQTNRRVRRILDLLQLDALLPVHEEVPAG